MKFHRTSNEYKNLQLKSTGCKSLVEPLLALGGGGVNPATHKVFGRTEKFKSLEVEKEIILSPETSLCFIFTLTPRPGQNLLASCASLEIRVRG